MAVSTAHVWIDGLVFEIEAGQNLLHACLSLGMNLPYFCWHPALGSVGACRQCAIKQFRDEKDTRGRLVMACMTPATDGMRVSLTDPDAAEFRQSVIEWLMTNHPHDCPVCDEGGECHLQDMTQMARQVYRRYRFRKRTFRNQDLGPFVNHEMNRCITCYRCVRFYRDFAGGRDLEALGIHNTVYFGRHEDGVLESEFAGNLVEVCPTGVFTDKTLKSHYTRKWDLEMAPSLCVHCAVGCNTIAGARYGSLRRILNRYNGQVNRYFLCDRGRYGYEFVNGQARVRHPLTRAEGQAAEAVTRDVALGVARSFFPPDARVIGIGSPRASLEGNFALRALVGTDRFHAGVADHEHALLRTVVELLTAGPVRSPSLEEIRQADAVIVLGENLPDTAPVAALGVRQSVRQQTYAISDKLGIPRWSDAAVREAVQDEHGPLFVATPYATRLDDIATIAWRGAPDDIARLGWAVAHELDARSPDVPGLADAVRGIARRIAEDLRAASQPVVVSGTSLGSETVMRAAAAVATAVAAAGKPPRLSLVVPECNSLGLALLGAAPLGSAMEAVRTGRVDTVVVIENDLFRRAPAGAVRAMLDGPCRVLVIDHLLHDTAALAHMVLPAATFAESDGTLVNAEGRAQRFYQVHVVGDEIQESWRWLRDLMAEQGREEAQGWKSLDDVAAACAREFPALEGILRIAPPAGFRIAGQRIARQPHRYSGRTAIHADVTLQAPKPPDDPDSPLAFSMEGNQGDAPPALIPFYWAPGWNSVQALTRFQEEVAGPLRGGDPGARLLEPRGNTAVTFGTPPRGWQPRPGKWLVVPRHHVFGSEELSRLSPPVVSLAPASYVALGPDDAARLGVGEGEALDVRIGAETRRLPLQLDASLPRGVAALPVGLPGLASLPLPQWAGITRAARIAA